MTRKAIFILGTLAVISVVAFKVADSLYENLHVNLPRYEQPDNVVVARSEFEQSTSATGTITPIRARGRSAFPTNGSLRWNSRRFRCRQPACSAIPLYLDRYGFIANVAGPEKPPLPVGMAHGGTMMTASGEPWLNPKTRQPMGGNWIDLLGLPHRPVHLQGHRGRDRRRIGSDRPVQAEAGHRRRLCCSRVICPAASIALPIACWDRARRMPNAQS